MSGARMAHTIFFSRGPPSHSRGSVGFAVNFLDPLSGHNGTPRATVASWATFFACPPPTDPRAPALVPRSSRLAQSHRTTRTARPTQQRRHRNRGAGRAEGAPKAGGGTSGPAIRRKAPHAHGGASGPRGTSVSAHPGRAARRRRAKSPRRRLRPARLLPLNLVVGARRRRAKSRATNFLRPAPARLPCFPPSLAFPSRGEPWRAEGAPNAPGPNAVRSNKPRPPALRGRRRRRKDQAPMAGFTKRLPRALRDAAPAGRSGRPES